MDEAEKRDLEERNAHVRTLRAANGNLIYPGYPADALARLNDPRLDDMVEGPKGIQNVRALHPDRIVREPSKYLTLKRGFTAQPSDYARWTNEPRMSVLKNGSGLGFDHVPERPRVEQPKRSPKKLFHFWEHSQFFVASPDVLDLLREACPDAIASIPIEWVFSDGLALDGYEFVDVIAMHDAYDYRRSVVNVELRDGKKYPSLGYDRALREDIPASARLFRDSFWRSDVFVSRDLATRLACFANRELTFYDVQTHRYEEFPRTRKPRAMKARLKQAPGSTDTNSTFELMTLLRSGQFDTAEKLLTGWMKALPNTSFHAILDLSITTPVERCAEFFNAFCAKARKQYRLKALYSEMNGFAINPDRWFCDAFGFNFDGGEDGHDWLGEFHSSSDESLIITGLEPVQEAFAAWMAAPQQTTQDKPSARSLAEALVIVKFQRWLQRSVGLIDNLDCPFWATAHDYYEYLGRVDTKIEVE